MLLIAISVVVLLWAGYAISKNYEAKAVLFAAGLLLLYIATMAGQPILGSTPSSGFIWADPFVVIRNALIDQYKNAGLIIMTLFGFTAYMSHIGANQRVIDLLSQPLSKIRSPYLLVPLVFWIGTLGQIIIPSAASLSVVLMSTLYPVLRAARMPALTAGAVIATTATIVPTPLGGDNVVAAKVLGFDHVLDYVLHEHAPITLPTLFFMGIAHYFWQRYQDRRDQQAHIEVDLQENKPTQAPMWFAIFPVLPLILVVLFWVFLSEAKVGLVEITLFSFLLAFIAQSTQTKSVKSSLQEMETFFKGMGSGFTQVVVLIVAASTLVAGLKAMGLISALSGYLKTVEHADASLMVVFALITALITFISGSGNAVFYSFIDLIPQIAHDAGINPVMIALPMQCTSNLIRSMSPVAAVIIIVAAMLKVSPLTLVKRTCVPILTGFVSVLVLSAIRYL